MSTRSLVVNWLFQKVGFPFNESELSPALRTRVGQLAELRAQVEFKNAQILQKQQEVAALKSRKGTNTIWIVILVILGAVLLVVVVGAALLVGSYLMYRKRKQFDAQIKLKVGEMVNLNAEMVNLNASLGSSLAKVSEDVITELSEAHEVRTRGITSGPTIQLVKETVREVVMIPCTYCGALMPQTSRQCPDCGASRKT
jgi:hypothetical protein